MTLSHTARCPLSDLIEAHCVHCVSGDRTLGPAPTDDFEEYDGA